MGREMRRVAPDWQHPFVYRGSLGAGRDQPLRKVLIPLHPVSRLDGLHGDYEYEARSAYHSGGDPFQVIKKFSTIGFMPPWKPEEATHYMMYENTSEGTPISPAFATPEELARWLVDNKASVFADMVATYEEWMQIIVGDGTCGVMITENEDGTATVEPVI